MEIKRGGGRSVEQCEMVPKRYSVGFDVNHFGDEEIPISVMLFQQRYGSTWIPGEINEWWERICRENGYKSNDSKLDKMVYHFIELARNAHQYAGSGELSILFESDQVVFEVSDNGEGIESEAEVKIILSMGHGLCEVKKFADTFLLETGGRRYEKIKGKKGLVVAVVPGGTKGLRVRFSKKYKING